MFGGLTHRPAVALAEMLVDLTPAGLNRVFLCDSGSVAIEVALKMALQYWVAKGRPSKRKVVSLRGAYHGDTFGAMALCDPVSGMHAQLFAGSVAQQLFAPRPDWCFGQRPGCRRCVDDDDDGGGKIVHGGGRKTCASIGALCADALEAVVRAHADEVAAVILEPMVQGAGGMNMYDPAYVRRAREICDAHGVLLIADEIATGFGRTGELFACDHAAVAPDILCVGKALTGGYLSMAATLATDAVALADHPEAPPLMHGPTFMGNALAASIACASLDLLTNPEYAWRARVQGIENYLALALAPCADHPAVKDVRVLGAIGVVELHTGDHDHAAIARALVESVVGASSGAVVIIIVLLKAHPSFGKLVLSRRGVWLRTFRNLIYTMPPFIIEPDDLETLTSAICDVVALLPAPRPPSDSF